MLDVSVKALKGYIPALNRKLCMKVVCLLCQGLHNSQRVPRHSEP